MFIAPEFQENRPEEIQRLVQDYPLATIVAHTDQGLIANHIPLLFKSDNILIGHIAKANEMYALITENQSVLAIFKGEDAYISANDYPSKFIDHKKVPTWNYQAVHVHGTLRFYNDQKSKLAAVGMLTKIQEQKTNGAQAWKMSDAPKDYLLALLEDLVVFEIEVTRIQAQSKLSQNREPTDFNAVIKRLKGRDQADLAQAMSNLQRN
ncbi:transcriptional regulator [Acinetobacter defluvii]|uniref:FMN-binding negative transcriptional regulator n=1 Tax=Acinetobacter defluvii TaxID=1871111 RepID=UPI00148F7EBE|nr:FMN-binding negative transcriptional regulator [Acinetobacter defluvii]NNP73552.1 transcriptional regulator [Acinetobacter defluvii]